MRGVPWLTCALSPQVFIQDLFPESEELKNIYDVLNVLVAKCRLVEKMLITGTWPHKPRVEPASYC
jgi:hypothetical protein